MTSLDKAKLYVLENLSDQADALLPLFDGYEAQLTREYIIKLLRRCREETKDDKQAILDLLDEVFLEPYTGL